MPDRPKNLLGAEFLNSHPVSSSSPRFAAGFLPCRLISRERLRTAGIILFQAIKRTASTELRFHHCLNPVNGFWRRSSTVCISASSPPDHLRANFGLNSPPEVAMLIVNNSVLLVISIQPFGNRGHSADRHAAGGLKVECLLSLE